jgi:hypothetical protein
MRAPHLSKARGLLLGPCCLVDHLLISLEKMTYGYDAFVKLE